MVEDKYLVEPNNKNFYLLMLKRYKSSYDRDDKTFIKQGRWILYVSCIMIFIVSV